MGGLTIPPMGVSDRDTSLDQCCSYRGSVSPEVDADVKGMPSPIHLAGCLDLISVQGRVAPRGVRSVDVLSRTVERWTLN